MAIETIDATGSISTEKQTYRAYVKTTTDAEGKTVVSEIKAQAETDKKAATTGVSANWQKLEDDGYTLFSENEFIKYIVKSEAGFRHLVPSEEQRVYIIQRGVDAIQNAKAAKAMTTLKEGAAEPTPESNLETIDMRDALNEAPQRRSLSDLEKLEKLLAGLNLSKEQKAEMLLTLASSVAAQSSVTAEDETAS